MKRMAKVYINKELAGILSHDTEYSFRYIDSYFNNSNKPAISLSLPKSNQEYTSTFLFPFFFNLLSEGVNRQLQSKRFKLSETDYFGLLLATAQHDTIGAITLEEIKE
jgi:serine/threonine-protein kinase HipA